MRMKGLASTSLPYYKLTTSEAVKLVREEFRLARASGDLQVHPGPAELDMSCHRCFAMGIISVVLRRGSLYIGEWRGEEDAGTKSRASKKATAILASQQSFPFLRLLRSLKKTVAIIDKLHPKCAGCGMLFGEYHAAFPVKVDGLGSVCQWCSTDIKRFGLPRFLKRLKHEV